jgi:regulator of sigma E protease
MLTSIALISALVWLLVVYHMGYQFGAKLLGFSPPTEMIIGLGPRMACFTFGRTKYELRLVPLVGASNMDTDQFQNRKGSHFWLLLCGPFSVIITGLLVVYGIMLGGIDVLQQPGALVVMTNSDSEACNLQPGDVIIAIDDRLIRTGEDLCNYLSCWDSRAIKVDLERDGNLTVARWERQAEQSGQMLITWRSVTEKKRFGKLEAMMCLPGLAWRHLVVGAESILHRPGWTSAAPTTLRPGQALWSVCGNKGMSFLLRVGLMALSLGLLNLLPVPPLVGGQALIVAYEWLTGSAMREAVKVVITCIGLLVIISLIIMVFCSDVCTEINSRSHQSVQKDLSGTWSVRF